MIALLLPMDDASEPKRPWRAARSGLAGLLLALALPAAGADPALVSIGTGGKTGVYYLVGGAICDLVNRGRWETGVRCLAEASDGSIENLREVRSGARTFGIVQSDWQFHAVNGTGVFAEAGPDRELRSVFGLFPEPFTIMARPEAGILSLADLKGKRVSFGPAGSGGRATMGEVMRSMGWVDADFAYIADLPMPETTRALCGAEIDAAVFIVAHPNLTVEDMVSSCGAVLVPADGPAIERLIETNDYYASYEIPSGTYASQMSGVATFGPLATLVTSSRTPPAVVLDVTKAVFDGFETFRAAHPALADLERARMQSAGLTAPLHEGARRFFEGGGGE